MRRPAVLGQGASQTITLQAACKWCWRPCRPRAGRHPCGRKPAAFTSPIDFSPRPSSEIATRGGGLGLFSAMRLAHDARGRDRMPATSSEPPDMDARDAEKLGPRRNVSAPPSPAAVHNGHGSCSIRLVLACLARSAVKKGPLPPLATDHPAGWRTVWETVGPFRKPRTDVG